MKKQTPITRGRITITPIDSFRVRIDYGDGKREPVTMFTCGRKLTPSTFDGFLFAAERDLRNERPFRVFGNSETFAVAVAAPVTRH